MSTHYGSSGRRRPNATPATLPAHPAMHLEARLQDLDRLWQRPDRALPPATAHHSSTAALSAAPCRICWRAMTWVPPSASIPTS